MRRLTEFLIERLLFLCAAGSILVTAGIIVVLVFETGAFFREVPLTSFLFGTTWTPLFYDKHFGILPLVSGTILALSRPLSPMFVVVIVAALLALFGWRPMLRLARDRRGQIAAAAVALSSLSTFVWVMAFGTLDQTPGAGPTDATLLHNVRLAAGKTPWLVESMIGIFGWLDTGAATVSVYAWLFAVATLLLLGLATSGRREAAEDRATESAHPPRCGGGSRPGSGAR